MHYGYDFKLFPLFEFLPLMRDLRDQTGRILSSLFTIFFSI